MALICETKWAADKATYICNVVGGNISDVDMSKKKMWQRWDSNPRPFGLVPKTSALDRSAMLPWKQSSKYTIFI